MCWDGEKVVESDNWNDSPNRMILDPVSLRWIVYGGELFSQLHTISPWVEERKTFAIPDGLYLKWNGLKLSTTNGPVDTYQASILGVSLNQFKNGVSKRCEKLLENLPFHLDERKELKALQSQIEETWCSEVEKRFEKIVPINEECPVCMEVPKDRHHLCSNRHMLCESCSVLWNMRDDSRGCPFCKDDVKWLRGNNRT
jgi:hypothetical protein